MASVKLNLLIVQPWFTAKGHPAQSLINTANVIGFNEGISYLISRQWWSNSFRRIEEKIGQYGHVESFLVPNSSIRMNTVLSLLTILCRKKRCDHIFFMDAHLVLLTIMWPMLSSFVKLRKLSLIYLKGPERITKNWFIKKAVFYFLAREDTRLFLRTEELASAWRTTFPGREFTVLPSLELPDITELPEQPTNSDQLKHAVIGQIRPNKGIKWLVPLFQNHPEIGELTVAGTFFSNQHERDLTVLQQYPNFINRFLSEDDMIEIAKNQHFILMLYDEWDERMEAATLYLAVRANRPVIVREGGWCERMIRKYNCGLICKVGDETVNFFLSLPKPGGLSYNNLLLGLKKFRIDHSGEAWRMKFLKNFHSAGLNPPCNL